MSRGRVRVVVAAVAGLGAAVAGATTPVAAPTRDRTIALRNIHTDETVSVTYRIRNRYVPEAMKQINWIMRDWRRNEATTMDPALIDLIWEMHQEVASRQPINIISGYRSPATNNKLRKTTGGQAKNSRHILGMAADIQFPDVPVRRLRYAALVRERGGVGYYPTSGTPFVHVDTGNVRAWPRLPRHELALLFPSGRTRHLPSDGGPITSADTRAARARHHDLAVEVAQFHDLRSGKRRVPVLVASAGGVPAMSISKPPRVVARGQLVAALTPPAAAPGASRPAPDRPRQQPSRTPPQTATAPPPPPPPQLLQPPRPADRPARLAARPSDADRRRMMQLAVLAAIPPSGGHVGSAAPATSTSEPARPAVNPRLVFVSGEVASELTRTHWAAAPVWDADHPDESSYRPFPLAPFLTMATAGDGPEQARLLRPDFARMGELFDPASSHAPLQLRPGRHIARLIWADDTGGTSRLAGRPTTNPAEARPTLALRQVRTERQ